MAFLRDGRLTLELSYKSIDEENWIQYDVRFLWDDMPIVNEDVIKNEGMRGIGRRSGGVIVYDLNEGPHCTTQRDHLISKIETVIESKQPNYWETMDPDLVIGFYPGAEFPFMTAGGALAWETGEVEPEQRFVTLGDEPSLISEYRFVVIIMIDARSFKDEKCVQHSGLSLILNVTREELEQFLMGLKDEYACIRKK